MNPMLLGVLILLASSAARAEPSLSTFQDGRIVAINQSASPVTINFYARNHTPVKAYKLEGGSRTYIENNHLAITYKDKRGWQVKLFDSQGRQLADLPVPEDDPGFSVERKTKIIRVGRGKGNYVLDLQGKVLERRTPKRDEASDAVTQ